MSECESFDAARSVAPNDTTAISPVPDAIYVGTGGNITGRLLNSAADVVFKNIPNATELDYEFQFIRATGTTAADIVALYGDVNFADPVLSNPVSSNPPAWDSVMADLQDGDTIELDFTTNGSEPDGTAEDSHTVISTDETIGWPTLGLIAGGTTVKVRLRYGRGGIFSNWSNTLTISNIAAWTPAAYFISNTAGGIPPKGMLFVPDAAHCFTDITGTTAVTAIGQQVAYVKDQSGNGVDIAQATAGKRPTYQTTTGTFGTGLPYLQFDGVDDELRSGTASWGSAAQPMFVGHSIKPANTNTTALQDGIGTTNRNIISQVSGTGWAIYAGSSGTASFTLDTNDHVITALFSGASSYVRRDGVQSATLNAGTQAMSGITLCADYYSTSGQIWGGRYYGGFLLYTNPSATLRSLLETWLTGLHP